MACSLRLSHISSIPMSICTDSVSMRMMSSEVSGNRESKSIGDSEYSDFLL